MRTKTPESAGGRASLGVEHDISVRLERAFAGVHLPATCVYARRHEADLAPLLRYLPSRWPYEDRLIAYLLPSLKTDVFSYYGAEGPDLGGLFSEETLARLDRDLVVRLHCLLTSLWRLTPAQRDKVWKTRRKPVVLRLDDLSTSSSAHEAELADVLVSVMGGTIRVEPGQHAGRWTWRRLNHAVEIATFLFGRQMEFLRQGPIGIAPMTLQDVADGTGMDQSTVSRIVDDFVALTPRGLVPLKSLLSGRIRALRGEAVSASAVREHVRALVSQETSERPLTDDDIVLGLRRLGIVLARRTVAKYRNVLRIPGALERRRQAGRGDSVK